MNIVLGDQLDQALAERHILLRLDSFSLPGQSQPVRSYCVIESIPLNEMSQSAQWTDLHENLMKNYDQQNWTYCEQALEHLMGRWNGELDSFYQHLLVRVKNYQQHGVSEDWTPIITR